MKFQGEQTKKYLQNALKVRKRLSEYNVNASVPFFLKREVRSSSHVTKTMTTIYGNVQTNRICQNGMHFHLFWPANGVLIDGDATGQCRIDWFSYGFFVSLILTFRRNIFGK